MSRTLRSTTTAILALALAACGLLPAARPARGATPELDRAAILAVLDHAGLLSDPFASGIGVQPCGGLSVSDHVRAGAPRIVIAYEAADAGGRPTRATVTAQRWLTGTLEIRPTGARARDPVVRKVVRDSCVRQVTLRRLATADDPAGASWRVATMSPLVRLTPNGRATLPLVDLDTRAVSGGFLSVLSDLDELAVRPQTCAVTASGDSVRVFVGGIDPDADVVVLAGDQRVSACRRNGSHAEATVALRGPAGLRQVRVTVFPRATLADANAPADTRTWVLPILVGTPPPPAQEYFAL